MTDTTASTSTRPDAEPVGRADRIMFWTLRAVWTLGVLATLWAIIATGPMLVHGQPAYAILLAVTLIVTAFFAIRSWATRRITHRKHKVLTSVLTAVWLGVIALCVWFIPSSAVEPALTAMKSDSTVTVTETATQIVMTPHGTHDNLGVFFEPGARVDARAYAAVLRPLAQDGHTVVIDKQPFGIAFFSVGAFNSTRSTHPGVTRWIVGGHSLGGTVASMNAQQYSSAKTQPAVGLLLYASYPASDISTMNAQVLSISGSRDGLATPAKITASKPDLPTDTTYTVIEGGIHAYFGDYGPQAGDGQPTITHDQARNEISHASLAFANSLDTKSH